jgi:hypothetical protein
MSELLWVAVPGGTFERGKLLRVLIVPKLQGGSLAEHGMQSWPPRSLVEATLEVQFVAELAAEPDAATPETVQVKPDVAAQPGVWERLLANKTVETPGPNTESGVRLHVEPTLARANEIKETFEESAMAGIAEGAQEGTDFEGVVRAQLAARWSGPEPSAAEPPEPVPGVNPALVDPLNDSGPGFHRSISLLREHPAVLKALGLIIELRVAAADVPFPEGFVRVRWPRAPETLPALVPPWTQYGSQFLPVSTANISAGMVTLTDDRTEAGDPRWEVVSVDVDGAVGRLRDAARTLARSPVDRPATLPTLRSAGLQLVRPGRRDDLLTRLRGSMSDAPLTADNLLLGYRIDIRPSGGEWLSLHKRRAIYTAHGRDSTGGPSDDVITIGSAETLEEGHIKAHAVTSDENGTLHADEIVVRWSNWSLAVPKPKFEAPTATPNVTHPPRAGLGLSWEFHVEKGSLPPLRFGREYSVRARAVDMAGGGLELGDPAADRCATRPFKYARYEPVTSPDVTLSSGVDPKRDPSGSVDHVVIRSDPAIGLSVEDFARQDARYTPNPVRVLHPPRTTLSVAEQHGVFDLEGEDEEAIARKTWEWVKRAFPPAGEPGSPPSGEPRLPDPAAGGVMAVQRGEPSAPNVASAEQAWDEPWPDLKPKQVELTTPQAGRPAEIAWEGQRLVVRLAPAEQVTLALSTFPRKEILGEFELSEVVATTGGRHPMISPARTLTLVHAVRRPLLPPEPSLSLKERKPGETFAELKPKPGSELLGVDPKSTGQIEVTARWTETEDNQPPREVPETPVQTVTVDRGDVTLKDALRHEFGDTRHRKVKYTLKAVSRFRPYFHQQEDPDAFTRKAPSEVEIPIPSSARPPAPIVLSTRPAFAWEEVASSDLPPSTLVRRRLGGRLRVELQPPWHHTGEGELLGVVVRTAEFEEEFSSESELWPYITRVGTDPIGLTRGIHYRPSGKDVASTSGPPRKLMLQDVQGVQEHPGHLGRPVVVLPHEVWFRDGRWFADIALPGLAEEEYCPFVQLAVARYQPNSIEGHELSQVVQTEMVQLLPERTLTVNSSHSGFVEVRLEGADRPTSSTNFRNRVDVTLEQFVLGGDPILPPGMPASAVDLTALGSAPDGIPAWVARASASGDLNDPDPIRLELPSSEEFLVGSLRIRVREVELVDTRLTAGELPPEPQTGSSGELKERTVFIDVVPLGLPPS